MAEGKAPQPFLRWAGGKRRLTNLLIQAFPPDFDPKVNRFFEPFIGGGALMFATGNKNADILGQLWLWNRQTQLGQIFDSSSSFHLPNGADRSPDVSWIGQDRWDTLTPEEKSGFAPLCPDFVLELRSKNDSLESLQQKMQEYQENGAKLGWLIDRSRKKVEIYRPKKSVEVQNSPNSLSGEDILPGFTLDLSEIWN
jgi:Uma2 family endonuclease